jgi:carbonic anhydrase
MNILSFIFQLHLVHYNSSKYKSFAEAVDKPDGLAVFAFFIKVCINIIDRNIAPLIKEEI